MWRSRKLAAEPEPPHPETDEPSEAAREAALARAGDLPALESTEPAEPPPVREDYRTRRLELLRELVQVEHAQGLEIGAFDFPTVGPDAGRCAIADSRSADELARTFSVPLDDIAPVNWVLERGRPLAEQIGERFDYVLLCHVIEHVADPIRLLNDVAALLRPGGIVLLAVPDKRRTLDATRPSTTIDQLFARHHHRVTGPPLDQIMEFARAWNDDLRRLGTENPGEFYAWAVKHFESGTADAHCNVWQDDELFAQLDQLAEGGFLPELDVAARHENDGRLNEFHVALRKRGGA